MLEGSTFENQKEAYKRFLETEAQNTIDNRVNSLNTFLGYKGDGRLIASFDHLPVFQENENDKYNKIKSKVDVYDSLFEKGVIDINEYRKGITSDLMLQEKEIITVTDPDDTKKLLFDASLSLRGTVGGVQGILQINNSVALGQISRENAINMLVEIYQYERSIAETLITTQSNTLNTQI